jgi:RNA polymerase sigma factor (sigma-70 family)
MPAPAPADPASGDADDDDAFLLAAARRGDTTAFGELVMRHQSSLRRQLRHLMHGSDAVADELAQDTFVLAWRRIDEFRGEARFSTWLHRIAYRRFLMHARAETSRIETVATSETDEATADSGGAGDAAVERRLDVERALARLPDAQRLALFHCFQLELSHEEAAGVLGMPVGTLKSHVARGKARLRESLAAWAPARETKA